VLSRGQSGYSSSRNGSSKMCFSSWASVERQRHKLSSALMRMCQWLRTQESLGLSAPALGKESCRGAEVESTQFWFLALIIANLVVILPGGLVHGSLKALLDGPAGAQRPARARRGAQAAP